MKVGNNGNVQTWLCSVFAVKMDVHSTLLLTAFDSLLLVDRVASYYLIE